MSDEIESAWRLVCDLLPDGAVHLRGDGPLFNEWLAHYGLELTVKLTRVADPAIVVEPRIGGTHDA